MNPLRSLRAWSAVVVTVMAVTSVLPAAPEATSAGGAALPAPEWLTVVERAADPTQYNHDSALIRHQGEWLLGWNGNTDTREGVAGQKNYFARAPEWNGFRGKAHVAEFQSPEWSVNPVSPGGIEWHPTLMEFDGRLECWWFATSSAAFPRSVGYKSVWDDQARKWTNYKIQLRYHGRVEFSARVEAVEEHDRLTIKGTSYVPMPLATPVHGRNGELVMPMIISPSPTGGQLGGPNEVVIFTSSDHGQTWAWGPVIGKEEGAQRGSVWEPWMTWDGKFYHLFYRNFGVVLPGKGYSHTSTTDLRKWPAATDAPLDMMPMRGETVTDGTNWYVALCERPQVGDKFLSTDRRALTLYRARNGIDWQPVAALTPTQTNAFYCWLYCPGDGYIYFSTTTAPNIAVGRIRLPDPERYYVYPQRKFPATGVGNPWSDGDKVTLAGAQTLRLKAEFNHGAGFSFAALCRTGPVATGVTLDFLRQDGKTWGYGVMPILDCEWRAGLPGWATDIKTAGFTARTGEVSFVGLSFDEGEKIMRIVRRNQGDAWETKEWHVQTLYLDKKPAEGTVTVVDGLEYYWRAIPAAPRDVALVDNSQENLRHLGTVVLKNDPGAHGPVVTAMYTTGVKAVRSHVLFFFEARPEKVVADGKYLRNDGNTFDVPKDRITFNGNNRTDDPAMPNSVAGMELWRFGLWNRQLSTDDFKALYNAVAPIHQLPLENTASSVAWDSAPVLLDPTQRDKLPAGVNWAGHNALLTADGVTVYGDGSAAIEVPGNGDWEWEAEFRFDETPAGLSWDLLTVGDKFNLGRLEIGREENGSYVLKRGPTVLCPLKPNEWTRLKIRYKGGNADLELPAAGMIRVSVRPVLQLGRWLADRIDLPDINRPTGDRTEWRNLHLTPAPGAR